MDQPILEITFGPSSSRNYKHAVSLAQSLLNYEYDSDTERHRVAFEVGQDSAELQKMDQLFEMVGSWKSCDVQLDGEALTGHIRYRFRRALVCSSHRARSPMPEQFCRRGDSHMLGSPSNWGCVHLRAIESRIPSAGNDSVWFAYYRHPVCWWHYGSFADSRHFLIDKEKLEAALLREAKEKYLHLCPVFDFEQVQRLVDALPLEIDLQDSTVWEAAFDDRVDGSNSEAAPIGIRPKRPDIGSLRFSTTLSTSTDFLSDSSNDASESSGSDRDGQRSVPETTFDEIGGVSGLVQRLREVIELPIKQPELFERLGIKPHKGVVLYGPPGNGKTMIARALAHEIDAHFIPIRASELISKWVGESEQNLRRVFDEAKAKQPTIIYLDEVDSIGRLRTGEESSRYDSRFLNQLLTLMDGFDSRGEVCVLASTNRIELLDDALLRPGRFDYAIEVRNPDPTGCYEILSICLRDTPVGDVSLAEFSRELVGLSGADIAFVAREAAYNVLRRSVDLKAAVRGELSEVVGTLAVELQDLERALATFRSEHRLPI